MPRRLHRSVQILATTLAFACATEPSVGPRTVIGLIVAPDSVLVPLGDSVHLNAIAIDADSTPYVGAAVTWRSNDAGVATVDANGEVHAVGLGATTVMASLDGYMASARVQVEPPPIITLSATAVAFSAVVGGADPAPDSALITNTGGPGLTDLVVDTVTYVGAATDWLQAVLSSSSAPTAVVLSVSIASLGPGTYQAAVAVASDHAANSPQTIAVTLTLAAAPPAAVSASAGDAQTATVNTAVATPPAVFVLDQLNNPAIGVPVTFAVTGGGGSVTGGSATTDANGIATVGSWTLGQSVGTNTLTATVAGTGITGNPVTFSATGVAGAATQMSLNAGNNQTATVNTLVTVPPAVLVVDAFSNPVAGVAVTFAVTAGGGSVTGGSATTNASGVAAVSSWQLGTAAGANALQAAASGLTGSPVTFAATAVAGPATQVALSAGDNQTATVNTTVAVPPAVLVRDQFGNPVAGVNVTFGVTGGGGSVTGGSATSGAGGVAAVASWRLGTAAGANTLQATAPGLAGSPVSFTATATAGAAAQISVSAGNNQSATVGTGVPVPPAVLVADQFGNGVGAVSVTFAVTSGGGSVTGANATSGATGVAAVGSWTLGSVAGSNTLSASAPGLAGSPITFTATGLSGAATQMVLFAGNSQTDTVAATLATAYAVRVTDNANNGVSGVPVAWTVTGGGGSITSSSMTDANGVATATRVLGTTAGTQTASAAVGGLAGSPVAFTATATPGSTAQVVIVAGNNQSATVNTAVATAPSVRVSDGFGNVKSGVGVTFSVTAGGGAVTGGSQTTNASGIATATSWTLGTVAGTNTLGATAAGLPGSPATFTATGTPGPVDAGQSTLTRVTATITACAASCVAGTTASAVLVMARDLYGNAINGATATLVSTGNGNTFSPGPTGTTSGLGTYTANFSSTVAQAKTISAMVAGVILIQTASVTVTPAGVSLSNSLLSRSHATITACATSCVAGTTASTITATVRDAFSNVISGATVTFSSTGGANSFSPAAAGATNASGVFAANFSSTTAQAKTISATVSGAGTLLTTAAVTVNAAVPASIAVSGGNNQTARVAAAVATDPSAVVRDAFANPVPNVTVTFAVTSGGGSATGTSQLTNASGIATVTSWTLGGSSADAANGTMANTLSASASGAGSTSFTASSFYAWQDVDPIVGTASSCQGCHDVAFTRNPNTLVNVFPTTGTSCDASAIPRVTAGNATNSVLYRKVSNNPNCGGVMPPATSGLNATQLKIIRAWINNGALNN